MSSPMNKSIPVEVFRKRLEYREEVVDGVLQGNLYWKYCEEMPKWWNTRFAHKKVGALKSTGYLHFLLKHNNISRHVLNHIAIYCIVKGHYPEQMLDHIDGNKTNNIISNLRKANVYLNNLNVPALPNKSSIHKGVCYENMKWRTQYTLNYKKYYVGRFDDEIEAAIAYNEAVLKNHDPRFVVLNKREDGYTNKEYPNKPRGWKPE